MQANVQRNHVGLLAAHTPVSSYFLVLGFNVSAIVAGSSFVGGFRIREDTGVHIFADAESTEMRDKGPGKPGGGGGGFMIREDTGVQATSKKQVGGFEIREDTGVQAMPTGLEAVKKKKCSSARQRL